MKKLLLSIIINAPALHSKAGVFALLPKPTIKKND